MHMEKTYLCIDLKSFYASVECAERGLDAMTTNLVVADTARSVNTICLAISPAMKRLGVKNRCRVGEIPRGISYITAPPRMQKYIDYSAEIYAVYLHYIAKEDIHVYSVDEAFMDVTPYLRLYHMSARELGIRIMQEIWDRTRIRASCGVGSNLYLAKIALDIAAKPSPDAVGELDEQTYITRLWRHRPLTDFWRVGAGMAKKLSSYGIDTMKGIAEADEDFLYQIFGVDAELLIDHAWGREPVTIADIKAYRPRSQSISSGQVLMKDYSYRDGELIVKEMMDLLCLDLVSQNLVTKSVTLHIGYSGFHVVEYAHGTASLDFETNADSVMIPAVVALYQRIVNPLISIRKVTITCNEVRPETCRQCSLYVDFEELERSRRLQKAVLEIRQRYGKNAVLKGMNLENNAMTITRNKQIGGHRA